MLIKLYDIHAPNECHIATRSNHPNVISVEGQNKCTQWFILMAPVMIFLKSKQFDHPQARLQGFLIKPRNYIGCLNIFIGWQNKWVRWSGKFLKLQHILTDYYMLDIIVYVQLLTGRDVQNWNILLCWYTENWELLWCQLCNRWQNCILVNTSSNLSLLPCATLHAAISNHHVYLHSLWFSVAIWWHISE